MDDNGVAKAANLFQTGLRQFGLTTLSDDTVQKLIQYSFELVKWNRKVNLIAKNTSLEDVVEKHFLDSLTLLKVLTELGLEKGLLLDVGSGAGFPGLVIKTVCPELQVTLLEPRLKRVSFLNHIIRMLTLSGIEVLPCRTDQKECLPEVTYDVITSRAVADVTSFLEMVTPLTEPGTVVICMQGASGEDQWQQAEGNPKFSRIALKHMQLPLSKADRFILVFRKEF